MLRVTIDSITSYHKLRKELIVIKTCDEESESSLESLIKNAQSGDKNALLALCQKFKPLIKSESHREMFFKSLGSDAESIATLAFIELVLDYEGTNFVDWPGYARYKVHNALYNAMRRQGKLWERESPLEAIDESPTASSKLDELAQLLLSLELQTALKKLTTEQRAIIELLFLDDVAPKDLAKSFGCTARNITKHKHNALQALKILLA